MRGTVLGVGVDVVETKRFERLVHRGAPGVWRHWYTEAEADECGTHARPGLAAALRFGVKEATYKAVHMEFSGGVRWRDIEVLGPERAPKVVLHGEVAAAAAAAGVARLHVSVCHLGGRVLTMVLAEGHATTSQPSGAPHVYAAPHTTIRGHG